METKNTMLEELKNGVDKETGRSVEIALDGQGHVTVCDYDGSILEQYPSKEAAKDRYLIF